MMGGSASCIPSGATDTAVIFSEFNGLPILPLDRKIPAEILKRRGGISATASKETRDGMDPKTVRRRGAVSYDSKDNKAVYIRYLGDALSKKTVRTRYDVIKTLPELPGSEGLVPLCLPGMCERRGSVNDCGPAARGYKNMMKGNVLQQIGIDGNQCNVQILGLLQCVDCWEFDIFAFRRITEGRPLFHIALHLLQKHHLVEYFNLDILKLFKFLSITEQSYHSDNPYHNCTHAADVLQALHCLLIESQQLYESLKPQEVLAALMAAITHDIDHPGVNQTFLINTASYLTSIHGVDSLLERHHIRSAHGLLSETGLLEHLSEEVRKEILALMDSLILATDISKHKTYFTCLEEALKSDDIDLSRKKDRKLLLEIAIKCADISNPCRPWSVCRIWSENIMEEFFRQGDCERSLNLPISFLCDRHSVQIPASQRDFIQYVVCPLFSLWHQCCHSSLSRSLLWHLTRNRTTWEDLLHKNEVIKGNSDEDLQDSD